MDKINQVAEELVKKLKEKKLVLSVSESFTGGNIAAAIVGVSGASEVFYEGIVSYNSDAKIRRLGVKRQTLEVYKPVSRQVAEEMCQGLLSQGNCDVAISTTGIAGPLSDDSNYPVGLCFTAFGTKDGITVTKHNFTGNRKEIIQQGTYAALTNALALIK